MVKLSILIPIKVTIVCSILLFSQAVIGKEKGSALESKQPLENGGQLENTQPGFANFDEVSGLIIDRTITRFGKDFYFFFSQKINDKYDNLRENLTIKERPTALSGSIISIFHSRKLIFRTALSPGRKESEEKAEQALQIVSDYITRWEIERLLMDTFDMDYDEF